MRLTRHSSDTNAMGVINHFLIGVKAHSTHWNLYMTQRISDYEMPSTKWTSTAQPFLPKFKIIVVEEASVLQELEVIDDYKEAAFLDTVGWLLV